ncbi:MAG: hypothetical protein AB8V23_01165 [Candidatus Midichloria sp.]
MKIIKITGNHTIKGQAIVYGVVGSASGVKFHNIEFNQITDNIVEAAEYSGLYVGAVRDYVMYGNEEFCNQLEPVMHMPLT